MLRFTKQEKEIILEILNFHLDELHDNLMWTGDGPIQEEIDRCESLYDKITNMEVENA